MFAGISPIINKSDADHGKTAVLQVIRYLLLVAQLKYKINGPPHNL